MCYICETVHHELFLAESHFKRTNTYVYVTYNMFACTKHVPLTCFASRKLSECHGSPKMTQLPKKIFISRSLFQRFSSYVIPAKVYSFNLLVLNLTTSLRSDLRFRGPSYGFWSTCQYIFSIQLDGVDYKWKHGLIGRATVEGYKA